MVRWKSSLFRPAPGRQCRETRRSWTAAVGDQTLPGDQEAHDGPERGSLTVAPLRLLRLHFRRPRPMICAGEEILGVYATVRVRAVRR